MIRTIELTICQSGTHATRSALLWPVAPRIAWPCIIVERRHMAGVAPLRARLWLEEDSRDKEEIRTVPGLTVCYQVAATVPTRVARPESGVIAGEI